MAQETKPQNTRQFDVVLRGKNGEEDRLMHIAANEAEVAKLFGMAPAPNTNGFKVLEHRQIDPFSEDEAPISAMIISFRDRPDAHSVAWQAPDVTNVCIVERVSQDGPVPSTVTYRGLFRNPGKPGPA